MSLPSTYAIHAGWRLVLSDLGIRPADVLRRAGLPDDLLARDGATLSTDEYFRLWRGLEQEAADPSLPLRIGQAITVEAFDPPVFAALCSPDLRTALGRIGRYKRLVCPMTLTLTDGRDGLTLELQWLDRTAEPPVSLVATELVFFVQLARVATRAPVRPLRVTTPQPPEPAGLYADYFGVGVRRAASHAVVFAGHDASRPFLTASDRMWRFFEPELRKRLAELDEVSSTADRVRGALLELLPSGRASIEAVADRLRLSTRTLQRRLAGEDRPFQHLLRAVREELARHYLRSSSMSGAEISFLLGFDDPNSFARAFHAWTGQTPERVRSELRASTPAPPQVPVTGSGPSRAG